MNKIPFYRIVTLIIMSLLLFSSCDQDFNEMGSGIVDDDHFSFKPDTTSTVLAFTQYTGVLQSNNFVNTSKVLPIYPLGVYNNAVFGRVRANFVTQLQLATVKPDFSAVKNPVLDSVVLTIPYLSTKKTEAGNKTSYTLESMQGSSSINLKVFESGYVLNNLNPEDNFQTQQLYFSNQDSDFDVNKKGTLLNNSSDSNQNSQFLPSDKEVVRLKVDRGLKPIVPSVASERLSPRMQLKLDKAFFQQKIMNAPADKLINNSIFQDYFRGIYFQVENSTEGTLMQLDFSKGDITLYYHEYASVDKAGVPATYADSDKDSYGGNPKLVSKAFVLNMTGTYVSLLDTQNSNLYANALLNPNANEGEPKLYLKGGEGSIAVIDLFGPDNFGEDGLTDIPDGISDELNIIRKKGWLINEANLTFYIDRDAMGNVPEPQRIYLYDLNNNRPLIDWSTDLSGTAAQPKILKIVHDGIIQTEEGRGTKYRIRITNHIRNLIRKDSTNVRLGLAVTEYIGLINNVKLKTKTPKITASPFPDYTIDRVPAASLLNPLGTIIYGNNIAPGTPNYKKRLKLEIYYTKPN